MILKNRENLKEFDIPADWYKNRKPGVSAALRIGNEERWIGPCLESILPFFDEIVIAIECTDRTKEIIQTFDSPKIKVYDYPFKIGHFYDKVYPDTVHTIAYFYNWTMAKTTKTVVCKWDGDMVMLPDFYKTYDLIMRKNVVRTCGYQPVSLEPFTLSNGDPYASYQVRFWKVREFLYWILSPDKYWKIETAAKEKYELFTYSEATPKNCMLPFIKREGMPQKVFYYRLWNLMLNSDIYYGSRLRYFLRDQRECYMKMFEPTYVHTNLLKIKNNDIYGTSKEWNEAVKTDPKYVDWLKPGIVLEGEDIKLPDCIFKKPEEYL
jgi:hypothetical protein